MNAAWVYVLTAVLIALALGYAWHTVRQAAKRKPQDEDEKGHRR